MTSAAQSVRLIELLQRPATYGIVKAGEFQATGVPMLRGGDIKGGRIGHGLPYVTKRKSDEFSRTVLQAGDVVVALVGYPGDSAVVPAWLVDANISRAVGLLRPGRKLLSEYLAQYLNSPVGRAEFLKPSAGSAQIVVNLADLNKLHIPLPPIDEQRKIADALGDIDELIASLEQVVAKKRSVKQGMMQALLTSRSRLQGFTDSWSLVRLADVANVDPESLSPATTSRSELIDYISLEEVSRGSILGSTAYRFGDAPSRARRRIRSGDVLFGTVRPNLQSHAMYAGGLRYPVASTGFAVIRSRPGTTEPSYLAQWVLSTAVMVQIDRIIAGSNYPAVSSGDVRSLEMLLPSAEEQKAIGAVLRDVDAEIDAVARRLESTRALKRGMMQELLTGRTRLLPTKTAA